MRGRYAAPRRSLRGAPGEPPAPARAPHLGGAAPRGWRPAAGAPPAAASGHPRPAARHRAARWARWTLGTAALVASALPARAWTPPPIRIAELVAEGNRAAGRAQGLRLALAIRDARGRITARGRATVWPGGLRGVELDPGDVHVLLQQLAADSPNPSEAPESEVAALAAPPRLLQADDPERVLRLLRAAGGGSRGRGPRQSRRIATAGVLGGPSGRVLLAVNDRPALWLGIASKELLRVDSVRGFQYRLGRRRPASEPWSGRPGTSITPPHGEPLRVDVVALSLARGRERSPSPVHRPRVRSRPRPGAPASSEPDAASIGDPRDCDPRALDRRLGCAEPRGGLRPGRPPRRQRALLQSRARALPGRVSPRARRPLAAAGQAGLGRPQALRRARDRGRGREAAARNRR